MRFQHKTQWYDESPEGYRVSRALVHGAARFSAWSPTTSVSQWNGKTYPAWNLLGSFDSAEEAQRACEEHASDRSEDASS